jgi:hypothetical protein
MMCKEEIVAPPSFPEALEVVLETNSLSSGSITANNASQTQSVALPNRTFYLTCLTVVSIYVLYKI